MENFRYQIYDYIRIARADADAYRRHNLAIFGAIVAIFGLALWLV